MLETAQLAEDAKVMIRDPGVDVCLSAASAWEIAIKHALGKLELPEPPAQFVPSRMAAQALTALPVQHVHALHVATLPPHHSDPFDRLLVAQAQIEGLSLMTADAKLLAYDVDVVWAGLAPPPPASRTRRALRGRRRR